MVEQVFAQLLHQSEGEGAKLDVCDKLKMTPRIVEKECFAGSAAGGLDVVRGMIVVTTMGGIEAVLELLEVLARQKAISIVRIKDRFCTSPSTGGYGARFSTALFTRECYSIPRLLA
jgi:hypothetical protein